MNEDLKKQQIKERIKNEILKAGYGTEIKVLSDKIEALKKCEELYNKKSGCNWCLRIKPWLKKTPPFKWLFLFMSLFTSTW